MNNAANRQSSGQALIAILLIMAAALTLGLAASQQVVTDLKVTRQQEESAKAYAAAEAGVEKALVGESVDSPLDLGGGVVNTVEQKTVGGNKAVIWPDSVDKGQGMVFWLVDHDQDGNIGSNYYQGNLRIYWRMANANNAKPAILATLYYQQGQAVKYWAVDPDSSRLADNNFTAGEEGSYVLDDDSQDKQETFNFRMANINISNYSQPIFLWVRVFYSQARLGFQADSNLPTQGTVYFSRGEVAPSAAPEVVSRRLQAFRTYAKPPLILLEPLTSFGKIEAGK